MRLKYLSLIVILFLIAGSAVYALSNLEKANKRMAVKAKPIPLELQEPEVMDTALLARFTRVSAQFDSNQDIMMVGQLSATDGADSLANIINAPYVFCKRGNEFFYKLGYTETINAKGIYVLVDHELKKIMVSAQQPINLTSPFPSAEQMLKNLRGEGYSLTSKTNGQIETLSFYNPLHLSCKEYSVGIDRLSNQVNRIFMRLTNPMDNENPKLDKTIELKLSKLTSVPKLEDYVYQPYVKLEDKTWKLTEAYQHYELITN